MGLNGIIERLFAGRWIAGETFEDALRVAMRFNSHKISVLINYLGEDISDPKEVDNTVAEYSSLINIISKSKLNASISIKPTQIGYSISEKLFFKNYSYILNLASKRKIFLWLDMEDIDAIESTIDAYLNNFDGKNSGICIQAYLKRSAQDIRRIVKRGGIVRLVKGAYSPKHGGFGSRALIDNNYKKLLYYLFLNSKQFMVATHDAHEIDYAVKMNRKWRRNVVFGMLNGINNRYAASLAKNKEKVAIYIPYGPNWISYSYRRLKEEGHAITIIKSLGRRQSI